MYWFLQETFPTPDKSLAIPKEVVYQLDRSGRPGGGLAIAVNAVWSSIQLNFGNLGLTNELMGIHIFHGSVQFNVLNIYSS